MYNCTHITQLIPLKYLTVLSQRTPDFLPLLCRPYHIWHTHINQYELYSPEDPAFQDVVKELAESSLVDLYQHEGGTQIKLVYYLESGLRAMFKPQRYPKDQETLPDHFYFTDYERYYSEIAAFHLDM